MYEEVDDGEEIMVEEKGLAYQPAVFEESLPQKCERNATYEMILPRKCEDDEDALSAVIGHKAQKDELLLVMNWFRRSKEFKSRGVSIPKGVILFGDPGNGKSLLIRELVRCCDATVFIFRGDGSNVVEGIVETFDKAKEVGHAVIVIDELDLLINRERRVVRALQECLDGVESNDDVLVISATNNIADIPNPLLRPGRLDKIIDIPDPTGEEALELLKKHLREFGVTMADEMDDDEVALSLSGISCAGVKSVVNDLVLRHGFDGITEEMLDESIYSATDRVKRPERKGNLEVAVHEAGHAVMANSFPEFFQVNRLSIAGASGRFHAKEVEEGFWPYEKVIADIKVSMAGLIAQKLLFGRGSRGCDRDLQLARSQAYNLFDVVGYSSCWETLPPADRSETREETQTKRRRMERKIERLLRRCERQTFRYIKRHKEQILSLGRLLYEKKRLKSSEILSCIEDDFRAHNPKNNAVLHVKTALIADN